MHTGERFFKEELPENGKKEKIRLHHYIQSFKPNEVTPEEAHKIGEEWVWAMFRKNWNMRYQVLICTHVDKSHIHNHILVSAVDLDGKVWHDNMKTMKMAREQSDKLAQKHGLSIIENPKKGTMLPYSEYLARQNNNSWKEKLKSQIDVLVLSPDVKSIYDLAEKLQALGYEISGRKYMHIKRAEDKDRRPMSTLKLGDGYGLEELKYRIEMKNIIMPLSKVNSYSGIQREYAFCLRQIQFLLYRRQKSDYTVSYGTVRKNYELLCYLCSNNIHSVKAFEDEVNSADEKVRELSDRKKSLEENIASAEKVLFLDPEEYFKSIRDKRFTESPRYSREVGEKFQPLLENFISDEDKLEKFRSRYVRMQSELEEINAELDKAKAVRREVSGYYKTYLDQMETDYDRMLREMKELYEFNDEGITETYAGELDAMRYLAEIYKGTVTENTFVDYDRLERDYEIKYDLPHRSQEENYRSYGNER